MFISLAAALEFFQVCISLFLSFNGLHVTKEYGKLQLQFSFLLSYSKKILI